MADEANERSALLQNGHPSEEPELVDFSDKDKEDPRNWSRYRKLTNIAIISLMSIMSPLASSMFTPGIAQIAEDLKTSPDRVIGATTGFVVFLGIGPLILAPLSETFGRRRLYVVCFSIFALLQIPTALSPNIQSLIIIRTFSGFFGSVGIANGGGTISDMFVPSERAGVFGWYLLGPLLGPTLGPLFGGLIVQELGWRWIFWILTIVCLLLTALGILLLKESYAPVILEARRQTCEKHEGGKYRLRDDYEDDRPFWAKLVSSMKRPLQILFLQPIVFTMALYQAITFATTYSLYTNFQDIYSGHYGFNTTQVGLLYLGPGIGFLTAVWFIVPRIDTVFNALTRRNNNTAKPEFRLPIANIGSVLIPASLFWFAWSVQAHRHWFITIFSTFFYGIGQVTILNSVQNYYIDAFSRYAASAIAAGAVFRSLIGGVIPLFAPSLFEKVGYGWGISVFAFISLAIAPAPILFFYFGERVRSKYTMEL